MSEPTTWQRARTTGSIWATVAVVLAGAGGAPSIFAQGIELRIDRGHPWRPPFGLERVGRPIVAVVESAERPTRAAHVLTMLGEGKVVGSQPVHFPDRPPDSVRVPLEAWGAKSELCWQAGCSKPVNMPGTAEPSG